MDERGLQPLRLGREPDRKPLASLTQAAMPVQINVSDGGIDVGDDKRVIVSAVDHNGDPVTLAGIDLSIGPEGSETTYDINDFSESDNEYTLTHPFRSAGFVQIDCTVTDMGQTQERVTDSAHVEA